MQGTGEYSREGFPEGAAHLHEQGINYIQRGLFKGELPSEGHGTQKDMK